MYWVVHSCNIVSLFVPHVPQIHVEHRNTLMLDSNNVWMLPMTFTCTHGLFDVFFPSSRPFYVEPRNIVDDDPQERVSAEAAILNSRVHYYSRLTGSSDRLLVSQLINQLHGATLECLGLLKTPDLPPQVLCISWIKFTCGGKPLKICLSKWAINMLLYV